METKQTPNSGKKKGLWLILPFIIIAALIIVKLTSPKVTAKDEPANAPSYEAPVSTTPIVPTDAIFTPDAVIDMVDRNEDYIAGLCKKHGFNYYPESENSIFKYKYQREGNADYQTASEQITTWRDLANRLNYCIHDERKYNNFLSLLYKVNPISLQKNQRDKDYTDSVNLLVKDCVFIPTGYKKDFEGYCVVCIRKDKINPIIKANSDSNESNSDGKTFMVKSDKAYIFDSPNEYRKTSMFLNRGKKVQYIRTEGEYISCEYVNDEGIPIKGYILVDDVGKMR